nr:MAG TPA: hypothetical protein [Caudoviricetes sp.]
MAWLPYILGNLMFFSISICLRPRKFKRRSIY